MEHTNFKLNNADADAKATKDRGPLPVLFYFMLAFIVGSLVVILVLRPMQGGAGKSSSHQTPAQSSAQ